MSYMSSTRQEIDRKVSVSFAALDPWLETNIVLPVENETRTGGMVYWGAGNRYPEYLWELYSQVPTLQSVIDGIVDYVSGDSVELVPFSDALAAGTVNRRGDTIRDQVRDLAGDLGIYGGFALQVIRDREGRPAEIYWLDMRYVRTDKEATRFWYSEKWGRCGRGAVAVYPAYRPGLDWGRLSDAEKAEHASSVLYVRGSRRRTYPAPRYGSAVKACEMERQIDNFHINSLANGFYGSFIVNFNNGVPTDEIKEQIERDFTEKFAGADNAGRIMFSWNRDMTNRTTMEVPKVEDFGERYNALAQRARQEIFTAFRANPNLFGIPTEGNGFANEQYEESFRLFNKTTVMPMQDTIAEAYARILGEGALTITPMTLNGGGQANG